MIETRQTPLEFLQDLQSTGVLFSANDRDGFFDLTPELVLDFAKNPDVTMAKIRSVSLEHYLQWKEYVKASNSIISLDKFITNPPSPPKTRRSRSPIPESLRWEVWQRDNFRCRHCHACSCLSIDHIIPISKGGLTVKDNLQTLCKSCNSKKGATVFAEHA